MDELIRFITRQTRVFLILATVGLVAGILALTKGPALAAFPGVNGKIAFESKRDGNDEIYIMNNDGSGQTNGFESGDLSAWSSSATDVNDLSASSGAALTGNYGLQAVIDDNITIYVTDEIPSAETRYRARFYFDPNSITMANGDSHYLFYGYQGTSTVALRIQFRWSSGAYRLRAALRNDGNSWTNTSWFSIGDSPHFIEIDWRAATSSGANNGGLTLWIDGAQRANLTGVDNDTRRIDRVRLGAVTGIDSGTRGAYYFDAFESRRQTYIGP